MHPFICATLLLSLTGIVAIEAKPVEERPLKEVRYDAQEVQQARDVLRKQLDEAQAEDVLFVPLWLEGVALPVKKAQLEEILTVWAASDQRSSKQREAAERFARQFSQRYQNSLQRRVAELTTELDLLKTEVAVLQNPDRFDVSLTQKKDPAKPQAQLTVTIGNVNVESQLGYRRWDFERVFETANDVGVTLSSFEMWIDSPIAEARAHRKGRINVRVEPGKKVYRMGYMWLEGHPPYYKEEDLHGQMRMVFRGVDDNGHEIEVESLFQR